MKHENGGDDEGGEGVRSKLWGYRSFGADSGDTLTLTFKKKHHVMTWRQRGDGNGDDMTTVWR